MSNKVLRDGKTAKVVKIFLGVVSVVAIFLFVPSLIIDDANVLVAASSSNEKFEGSRNENETIIDMAGYQIPIPQGGLYDKYRSNPPLAVIKEKNPDLDLSWFATLTKERKDVGFVTYSPNFYYRNTKITAIYTVEMDKIVDLIPSAVKGLVKPISFAPGLGLIAMTSYAYHKCDNGPYNELSISIVTTKPNASNLGLISLMGEIRNKSLWGYVLKLPVDTELARVRGVVGYNLPKWLIPIKYESNDQHMKFSYFDENGNFDFAMTGKKLKTKNSEAELTRLNFINMDSKGRLTHGYSDVRAIKKGSSTDARDVELTLSNGPLSRFIKSLGIKKMVRYDFLPEFQAALCTPEILSHN